MCGCVGAHTHDRAYNTPLADRGVKVTMADVWSDPTKEDFQEPPPHLTSDKFSFNFQSTYPGGAVEKRRLHDCETLLEHLATVGDWRSTNRLANELTWSRRRVRDVIRAARAAIEHKRCTGSHGAIEDRWKLRQEAVA